MRKLFLLLVAIRLTLGQKELMNIYLKFSRSRVENNLFYAAKKDRL